ncbi:tyrosinase precursor [Metarhizium album ARSEF 1941]|uniref:tyrosinase n=1 Tax=Metarhizium album (strain ARSEF 1941) TaxID=1081103 RepID=A0A0B2WQI7_METAS|nr:tyrosinase precursor [Metarhizium album ARSEF 1941]KHN95235.1 tyrosinase precursor [Metarhizium album ARSEF 1941]
MRLSTIIAGTLGAMLAVAQSYDFGFDIQALMANGTLAKRQGGGIIPVGQLPRRGDGSLPTRQELRQLQSNGYMWDLFILALSAMQAVDQNDPLSWYQVAGIHGLPFVPWNGVQPVRGAEQSGYCTHTSILFLMWHRPYLALWEQALYNLANVIAGTFSDPGYRQAAAEFRIPYWDWSVTPTGQDFLPSVLWSPTIRQRGPNGVQVIANPLYSYRFHPVGGDAMVWPPFTFWPETKRGPNNAANPANPPSDNARVNAALFAQLGSLQQRLYILFSRYTDYNQFATRAWAASQPSPGWDSLESVHDAIHLFGGLNGNMQFVPASAFDPLFLLHHVNVDRLTAMWQILNGNAWMQPMVAGETSYTYTVGTWQYANSPLTPFYQADGTFWTSDAARNWELFGYTYQDADPSQIGLPQLQSNLMRNINQWWGGGRPSGLAARGDDDKTAAVVRDAHYTEWIVDIRVDTRTAVNGSFAIPFFIGHVPADSHEWESAPSHVGSVAVTAMHRGAATSPSAQSSSSLPLTLALLRMVRAGHIGSLDPEDVEPLLREKLQFRVVDGDKNGLDPQLVDGLYIRVTSSTVRAARSDAELPVWGSTVERFDLYA